jgi:putative lipoic acid-binding regulatory protein
MDIKNSNLLNLLDEQYSWPDYYTYKFVINADKKTDLVQILGDIDISEKSSRTGKFTSITARCLINNSQEVLAVYQRVSKIEGIISL